MRFLLWAVVSILLVAEVHGQTDATLENPGRQFALLVGCTEYPELRKLHGEEIYQSKILLRGPTNDTQLLRETLIRYLRVPEAHITVLAGWSEKDPASRPTHDNILLHLERLAKEVKAGDRVILHLAGHGSQQHDDDGDELDGMDEIFLPADVKDWSGKEGKVQNSITDDALGKRVRAIRDAGAIVWLIMDSCHSGTMVRGGTFEMRNRHLDPDLLGAPRAARTRGGDKAPDRVALLGGDLTNIVATYAAYSYQPAPEARIPQNDPEAKTFGLFSYTMARQIAMTGGRLSFQELHGQVLSAYKAFPYDKAMPIVEGDTSLRVDGSARSNDPLLWLSVESGKLKINGGRLQGLEKGTVLEVFQLGDSKGVPIGHVSISKAELTHAFCQPLKREGIILPPAASLHGLYPVRVVEWPPCDFRLKVAAMTPEGHPIPLKSLPRDIQEVFVKNATRFPFVEQPAEADWFLVVDGDILSLQPAREAGGQIQFEVKAETLRETLQKIFKVRNLQRLAGGNVSGKLPGDLKVEIVKVGDPTPLGPGAFLKPGDEVNVILQNRTGRIYDVTLLVIGSDYGVQGLYPDKGSSARLTGKDTRPIELGPFPINDESLGVEHILVIAVPQVESAAVIDFQSLAQPPSRHQTRGATQDPTAISPQSPKDPLAELLENITSEEGTRGLGSLSPGAASRAALGLISWQTDWDKIGPPPAFGDATATLQTRNLPSLTSNVLAGMGFSSIFSLIPDPWRVGTRVSLAKSTHLLAKDGDPEDGPFDLLLAGNERPEQVFLDVDEDTPSNVEEGVVPLIAQRRFDAEAVFHFLPDRRIAFYDTDNDGTFNFILIDHDQDPQADTRMILRNGKWKIDPNVTVPWLSSGYLTYLEGNDKVRASKKFLVLAGK